MSTDIFEDRKTRDEGLRVGGTECSVLRMPTRTESEEGSFPVTVERVGGLRRRLDRLEIRTCAEGDGDPPTSIRGGRTVSWPPGREGLRGVE